jgi:hypothetical protein
MAKYIEIKVAPPFLDIANACSELNSGQGICAKTNWAPLLVHSDVAKLVIMD